MLIAYVRVSSLEQNEARQLEALKPYNIEKVFIEKISGKNTDRPEFQKMMQFVRDGDVVYVTEWSRLSRNMNDLLNTIDELHEKGVKLISLKEGTADMSTPTGKLMMRIFAMLSEFERETIKERQAEGIAIAKAEGKYKGRKEKVLDNEEMVIKAWIAGEITATKASELLHCTRGTVYNKRKKYENTEVA